MPHSSLTDKDRKDYIKERYNVNSLRSHHPTTDNGCMMIAKLNMYQASEL